MWEIYRSMGLSLEDCGSVTQTGKAAFEWRIPNFFRRAEENEVLISPSFNSSGEKWQIHLYAEELTKGRRLKFSMRRKPGREIFSQWTAGIQTLYGTTIGSERVSGTECNFDLELPARLTTLKDDRSILVPSSTLTISFISGNAEPVSADVERSQSTETREFGVQCNVDIKTQTVERCSADGMTRPTSVTDGLSQNFKDLLESMEFSDATVRVREVDFRVHRAIMAAQSPVFAAMFRQDTSERASSVVDIKDCEPDIFRKFLEYVYTGRLEELSMLNADDLYQIADKYRVNKLKEECLQRMISGLSVQTFCHVIRLTLKYSEREFTAKATDFFIEYAREIVQTVEWQNFLAENPTWANELIVKAFTAVKSMRTISKKNAQLLPSFEQLYNIRWKS